MIVDLTRSEIAWISQALDRAEQTVAAEMLAVKLDAALLDQSPVARAFRLLYAALDAEANFQDWEHSEACEAYDDETKPCNCNWAETNRALRIASGFTDGSLLPGDELDRPDDAQWADDADDPQRTVAGQLVQAMEEPARNAAGVEIKPTRPGVPDERE
jgi:hypothetical protein